MLDDSTLLHRYAADRSDEAFAELVRRHVDLVYSAALRQLAGDPHLARDATQLVFIALARKAGSLVRHPLLSGWLYTATHHAASKLVRSEQRRRTHERNAHAMHASTVSPDPAPSWEQLRPLLDSALLQLGEPDRAAVLLRFFEGRSFVEIGAHLQLGEDAARKRVDRALDKLSAALGRRGIVSTSSALATALATHGVHAAPAGLAQAAAVLAIKTASSAGLVGATFSLLATAKVQAGLATTVAIASTVTFATQQHTESTLRSEIAQLSTATQTATVTVAAARTRLTALRSGSPARSGPVDRARQAEEKRRAERRELQLQALRRLPTYEQAWAPVIRRLRLQPTTFEALLRLNLELGEAVSLAEALARGGAGGVSRKTAPRLHEILRQTVSAPFEPRLRELLGDEGFAYYDFFQRTTAARGELQDFATAAANAGEPLTDEQMDRLASVLTDARTNDDSSEPNGVRPPIPAPVISRAAAILSPPQLARLAQLQSARLAAREIDARNRLAAARGQLNLSAGSSLLYLPPADPKPPETRLD